MTIAMSAAQNTVTIKVRNIQNSVVKPLPSDLHPFNPDFGLVSASLAPFPAGATDATVIISRVGALGGTASIVAQGSGVQSGTGSVTVEALGSLVWDEAGAIVT